MAPEEPEPGHVTIVRARYGGIYEPGQWIAFPVSPHQLPHGWDADDVTCMKFFETRSGEFGGGDSPQEAYEDLLRILRERRARLAGSSGPDGDRLLPE